jgi:hypothetical protein
MEAIVDVVETCSKVQESAELLPAPPRRPPPNAGKGRTKGVPNKMTAAVRLALMEALELAGQDAARAEALKLGKTVEEAEALAKAGGAVDYLRRLAWHEPRAFASLLARLLPVQVTGDEEGGPVRLVERIERVIVDPANLNFKNGKAG